MMYFSTTCSIRNFVTDLIFILITFIILKTGVTVRGQATDPDFDIGYTCTIYVDNKPKCSGALISRIWAITACLCVKDVRSNMVSVRIGDPTAKPKHKFYKSERVEIHPQCMVNGNEYNSVHDLALIQLNEPFSDSRYVYMAKIPHQLTYWTPDSTLPLNLAIYTDLKSRAKNIKDAVWHKTSLLLHPRICIKHLKPKKFKIGLNMCASYFHGSGTGDCKLDIGAALSYDYSLIGILIYKDKCGKGQGAGSFVNIPLHSEWIRGTTYNYTNWITL